MEKQGKDKRWPDDFFHLHNHTVYSVMDGLLTVGDLVHAASEDGGWAVGVTDHGNLMAVPELVKECQEVGLDPIIGCELNIISDDSTGHHLTLFARNRDGYFNLVKLVNYAHRNGFEFDPPVPEHVLLDHSTGLIALSGCRRGAVPTALEREDFDIAREIASRYREHFGADNYFIELQCNHRLGQRAVNDALAELGEDLGIPLVGTTNAHHGGDSMSMGYRILQAHRMAVPLHKLPRREWSQLRDGFLSHKLIFDHLDRYPGAIDNTGRIAEMCSGYIPSVDEAGLVKVESDPGSASTRLRELAETGLKKRIEQYRKQGHDVEEENYHTRLEDELFDLTKGHRCSAFVAMHKIAANAHKRGLPLSPGHANTAGSLVLFALEVTDLDPVAHDLWWDFMPGAEQCPSPVQYSLQTAPDGLEGLCLSTASKLDVQEGVFAATPRIICLQEAFRLAIDTIAPDSSIADYVYSNLPSSPQSTNFDSLISQHVIEELLAQRPATSTAEELSTIWTGILGLQGTVVGFDRLAQLVIPGDGESETLPTMPLPNGDVLAQYRGNNLECFGLATVSIGGLPVLDKVRRVSDLINSSQLFGPPFCWTEISLDDEATWLALQAGGEGLEWIGDDLVTQRLYQDIAPKNLHDLALTVVFASENAPFNQGVLDALQSPGLAPVSDRSSLDNNDFSRMFFQEDLASHLYFHTYICRSKILRWLSHFREQGVATFPEPWQMFGEAWLDYSSNEWESLYMNPKEIMKNPPVIKAHAYSMALLLYRLTWLRVHYPVEWHRVWVGAQK